MGKRIEATEVWFYIRMLKISSTEQMTNVAVLQRAGVGRELMKIIRQRELRFLGIFMMLGQLKRFSVMGKVKSRRGRTR